MNPDQVRLSRKMSYILRHNPGDIGIELDAHGSVDLDVFVERLRTIGGMAVKKTDVIEAVEVNDKQRFAIEDNRIRAVQGHSIDVDLGLDAVEPPKTLWHGTVDRFLDSILQAGLQPSGRTHVHLSDSIDTAIAVGSRRGEPVILTVAAGEMHHNGHAFHRSANGVWLVEHVPPNYLSASTR